MASPSDSALNRHLDSWARPTVVVMQRRIDSFRACGGIGFVLAVGVGTALTLRLDLSLATFGATCAVAAATFVGLAMLMKILCGEERLVYYHHEITILATVTAVVALLGEPVLPYLDVTIVGIGTFLVFGRVGCFMAGCCHGRPSRRGARYGHEHANSGVSPHLLGVPLFPVQLVEALWVLVTVAVGVAIVLSDALAGTALAWHVTAYGSGRFVLELARGDPPRPYWGALSEAQWISLALMAGVVGGGLVGALPLRVWQVALVVIAMVALVGLVALHYLTRVDPHRLLQARHVVEMASAMDLLSSLEAAASSDEARPTDQPGAIDLASTSRGLLLSLGSVGVAEAPIWHLTFSTSGGQLDELDARRLARLLTLLVGHPSEAEVTTSRPGIFHVVLGDKPLAAASSDSALGSALL